MASRDLDQQEALPFPLVNKQDNSSCPVLCSNNCGFFASPNTNNLCSVCYKKSQQTDLAAVSSPTGGVESVDIRERPGFLPLFRTGGTPVAEIIAMSESQEVATSPVLPTEALYPNNAGAVNGEEEVPVRIRLRRKRKSSPVEEFEDFFAFAPPETQVSPSPLLVKETWPFPSLLTVNETSAAPHASPFPEPVLPASITPVPTSPVPAPPAPSLPKPELKPSCASGSDAKRSNRCHKCRKRLCLGQRFKCRCGDNVFCSSHRFPDQHACTFDMKAVDRERILKENPLIKADKLRYRI